MRVPLRHHLIALAFYLGVAVVMTLPLVTVMGERMVGHPFGDTYEYTHHIWWINYALRTGQSPFFMPVLLYPEGLEAAWLWGVPLQSFPAWLLMFVLPLPVAFNLSALLTLALNGWAMWGLSGQLLAVSYQLKAKEGEPPRHQEHPESFEPQRREGLEESPASNSVLSPQHSVLSLRPQSSVLSPALFSGLVFMLYPTFQGQLAAGHTGLLVLWPVPLYVLALVQVCRADKVVGRGDPWVAPTTSVWFIRRAEVLPMLAVGVLFAVSLWGTVLSLIYLLAPITALLVLWLVWRRWWRALMRVLVALVLGGVLSTPFLLPVLREQVTQPATLREDGSVQFSASALGIVSPSFYHPLFSSIDYPHRVLGVDPFEGASYVGMIAAALSVIAFVKVRQARGWLLLAALAWLFSLGPLLKLYDTPVSVRVAGYTTYVSLPWALFQNLPLVGIARTPARFNFAVGFAVAVLAGYGAAYVWTRLRSPVREIVLLSAMALIAFEYQFFWSMPTVPATIPEPVRALSGHDDIRAVFNVPWEHLLTDKDAMYLQTGHGLPMIGGHITRRTPLNPAEGFLLQRTLDPALLDAAGVDIIFLHKDWADVEGRQDALLRERLGAPVYEDERIAVFEVPAHMGDGAGFVTSIELPDEITGDASLYFYAPLPGTVRLRGQIAANGDREAVLSLDNAPILEWTVQGQMGLNVSIEIESAGYHTLTLAVDPPCLSGGDPTLRCNSLKIEDVRLDEYVPLATS